MTTITEEDDKLLQRYVDWCNHRLKEYPENIVRPLNWHTFHLWLHYNAPDRTKDLSRLHFALCERSQLVETTK